MFLSISLETDKTKPGYILVNYNENTSYVDKSVGAYSCVLCREAWQYFAQQNGGANHYVFDDSGTGGALSCSPEITEITPT